MRVVARRIEAKSEPVRVVGLVDEGRERDTAREPDDRPRGGLFHRDFVCLAVEDPKVEREEENDEPDERDVGPHLERCGVCGGCGGRVGGEKKEVDHGGQ